MPVITRTVNQFADDGRYTPSTASFVDAGCIITSHATAPVHTFTKFRNCRVLRNSRINDVKIIYDIATGNTSDCFADFACVNLGNAPAPIDAASAAASLALITATRESNYNIPDFFPSTAIITTASLPGLAASLQEVVLRKDFEHSFIVWMMGRTDSTGTRIPISAHEVGTAISIRIDYTPNNIDNKLKLSLNNPMCSLFIQ